MNYKKIYAIKKNNEELIKHICPKATKQSGIYVFYRVDEDTIKHAYVGQAIHLCERIAGHLTGRIDFDYSLKKRKLYSENKNPYGYKIDIVCYCKKEELDRLERQYIIQLSHAGFQLYNRNTGGTVGKRDLADKPTKGYHDGLENGYKKAQKHVANLFEKNLIFTINGKDGVNKQKAKDKFEKFLKWE